MVAGLVVSLPTIVTSWDEPQTEANRHLVSLDLDLIIVILPEEFLLQNFLAGRRRWLRFRG